MDNIHLIVTEKENDGPTWKKHYELNKDKIIERNKLYRAKNNAKLKEDSKKYWQENKDKIKMRRHERITCPICNIEISRQSYRGHKKTARHLEKEQENNNVVINV